MSQYTGLDDESTHDEPTESTPISNSHTTPNSKRVTVILSVVICAIVSVAALIVILSIAFSGKSSKNSLPTDPLERAKALTKRSILIDGHNDTPWRIRELFQNQLYTINLTQNQPNMDTDIPRLREGGVGGQFWSVFVDCGRQWKDAVRVTLEQVDLARRMVVAYPKDFQFAFTADEIEKAFKKGRIASLFGMEGAHSIDSSFGALRMFYDLGVRYMTLTHNCDTPWAKAARNTNGGNPVPPNNLSLTAWGSKMIQEMNRVGMLVDISHVAESTMNDVLDVAQAPVIFSHSSAFALCPNPRNVPDEVLRRLPQNGGIVMVNFYKAFINCTATQAGASASIGQVADHIDHIRQVAGIDHIGIGADYDGVGGPTQLPVGLEDVSKYPYLFAELIRRGYGDDEIEKIMGQNLIRVLRTAEEISESLNNQLPQEEWIQFDFAADQCRTAN